MKYLVCLASIMFLLTGLTTATSQVRKKPVTKDPIKTDTLIEEDEYEEFMCAAGDEDYQYINYMWTDIRDGKAPQLSNKRSPFLTVKGNLQYDFTYRSLVDTPYSQKDFRQHTLQGSFDFMIRNSYPLHATLLARKSNSPYFSSIGDINVQFDRKAFIAKIREELASRVGLPSAQSRLINAQQLLERKTNEVQELQRWLKHPARMEEIIEERTRLTIRSKIGDSLRTLSEVNAKFPVSVNDSLLSLNKKLNLKNGLIDSLSTIAKDSLLSMAKNAFQNTKDSAADTTSMAAKFKSRKQKLDSLNKDLKKYEEELRGLKKKVSDSLAVVQKEIYQLKDPADIREYVKEKDVKDLPGGWNSLLNVEKVGIGRNWIDYSELTVKNISLTGLNVEVSPAGFYFAFAAGKVNYRFRDFVISNPGQPKQSLWMARAGLGSKNTNNIIFTYYNGKRNLLANNFTSASLQKVNGFSVESKLRLDARNFVVLEVAKSSLPAFAGNNVTVDRNQKMFDIKERRNEAYSIGLNSFIPWTATSITGHYKKMGDLFQSFNLQPLNVNQESYQFKVRQTLWKKQLALEAGVRKNDFSNQLIAQNTSSKMVFKSFQASLRIRKYPFVTIGYYPSSQLTIVDKDILVENQYNTLSTLISHSYQWNNLTMNTNLVNVKFYNNSNDTGFIYYNANTTAINHNINWKSLQFSSGCTIARQTELNILTLEQSAGIQIRQWLFLSAGAKYNRLNHQQTMWGENGTLAVSFKKLGVIQLVYDKSFLPGSNRNLLPLKTGTATYKRSF